MLIVIITMVMMILMTMIKVLVIFPHKRHSICKKLNDHCLVRHHLTFKRIGQAGEVKTEVQQEQISWQSWRLGHWGPLWATEGHWGPLRATEGHRGPPRATEGKAVKAKPKSFHNQIFRSSLIALFHWRGVGWTSFHTKVRLGSNLVKKRWVKKGITWQESLCRRRWW